MTQPGGVPVLPQPDSANAPTAPVASSSTIEARFVALEAALLQRPAVTVNAASASTSIKSGTWTTEHIMSYIAILLSALYGAGVIPASGTITQAFTVAAIALTTLGYNVSRGMVKSAAVGALPGSLPLASPQVARSPEAGASTIRALLALVAVGILVYSIATQIALMIGE